MSGAALYKRQWEYAACLIVGTIACGYLVWYT
jgi:hypothetical protein